MLGSVRGAARKGGPYRDPSSRSAVKKSQARIASAWERRNCDQVGPVRRGAGPIPAFFRISHAVDAVLLENRILDRELRDLGCQAARWYSLIRPLRTGFRRTCHVAGPPAAVTRGGWCALSGMRWPMP